MISMLKDSNFIRNSCTRMKKKFSLTHFWLYLFLYVEKINYFCRCFEVSVNKKL